MTRHPELKAAFADQLGALALAASGARCSWYVNQLISGVADELRSAPSITYEVVRKDMLRLLRQPRSGLTDTERQYIDAAVAVLEQPRDAVQVAEEERARQEAREVMLQRLRDRGLR